MILYVVKNDLRNLYLENYVIYFSSFLDHSDISFAMCCEIVYSLIKFTMNQHRKS